MLSAFLEFLNYGCGRELNGGITPENGAVITVFDPVLALRTE
jgi:hypothetical protein